MIFLFTVERNIPVCRCMLAAIPMRTLARRRGILAYLCIFQNGCGVFEDISGVFTAVHTVVGVVVVVAVVWNENLWVVLHGVTPSPVPGTIGTGNRDSYW